LIEQKVYDLLCSWAFTLVFFVTSGYVLRSIPLIEVNDMPGEKTWENPLDEAQALEVGEKLRRMRTLFGWTQDELAARAGITRVVVSRYEGARSSQKLADIQKILAVFGESLATFDEIFFGKKPTKKVETGDLSLEKAFLEVEGAKKRLDRATRILNRLILEQKRTADQPDA